jgi:hypothetical protein
MSFQALVYLLCMLSSGACLALLVRGYHRTRAKLLLWCSLCFVGLTLNNLFVVVDELVIGPEIDLQPVRILFQLAALGVLIYGFVWEADR